MTLKVPYNFVPLNKKVVTPYWIDHISHDVPFRDGLCGTLHLTLTAESPIFVKRGDWKENKPNNAKATEQEKAYEFEMDADGNYILPGSSVRGMVRSVVETLSFGRMIGRVSERRYAVRDLSNSRLYTNHFKLGGDDPIRGGWLSYDSKSGKYFLRDVGVPGRIDYALIKKRVGKAKKIDNSTYKDAADNEIDKKSARHKYTFLDLTKKSVFAGETDSFILETVNNGRDIYNYAPANYEGSAAKKGRIVMTGQPSPNKRLEFIFWETENMPFEVPADKVADFKFAYFDGDGKQESDDYKWRKKQLENEGEVPVFFKPTTTNAVAGLEHFGLSYLYKLPYKYSIEENINKHQENATKQDLADAIFGMVGEGGDSSPFDFLKGRVQFSHARTTTKPQSLQIQKVILGEPRASYYPNYIRQQTDRNGHLNGNTYATLMDDTAVISGRKRYPVLEDDGPRPTRQPDTENKAVWTSFRSLPTKTIFTCELNYHNLRPVELGAVLSAITLHGSATSRHQIGMGKPYGFGKLQVQVIEDKKLNQIALMQLYEAYMDSEMEEGLCWRESEIVREMLALSSPVDREKVPTLQDDYPYNKLEDFKTVKGRKESRSKPGAPSEALRLHSLMRGGEFNVGIVQNPTELKDIIAADRTRFPEKKSASLKGQRQEIKRLIRSSIDAKIQELKRSRKKLLKELTQKARLEAIAATERQRKEELAAKQAEQKRVQAEEQQQAAKRWAEKKAAAVDSSLDLSNMKPHREAIKKLKTTVNLYLERLRGKAKNQFSDEDFLLPESDHQTLIDKVKEIHSSGKAKKTDFGSKRLARTQQDIQRYLGEPLTIQLFQQLK